MTRDHAPGREAEGGKRPGPSRAKREGGRLKKLGVRAGFVAAVALTTLLGVAAGHAWVSGGASEDASDANHDHDDHDHSQERREGLLPPPVAHAQVERACVVAGGEQTLTVEADPDDQIRYRTRFVEQTSFADESLGATGEGTADGDGVFTSAFTVAPDVPEGRAITAVFVRDADGGYRGSTRASFDVADPDVGCPSDTAGS